MVRRGGAYWLEQYDLATHALISSTAMDPTPGSSLPPPQSLAVVPGAGACESCPSPTVYCTAKVNSQLCRPMIGSSGTASASSASPFLITATAIVNNKNGILFYGLNGQTANPWQGGFLCVKAPVTRTPQQNSGGNSGVPDCSGTFAFDFNADIQSGTNPLLVPGTAVNAQYWYRDPPASYTTGMTNALEFTICN